MRKRVQRRQRLSYKLKKRMIKESQWSSLIIFNWQFDLRKPLKYQYRKVLYLRQVLPNYRFKLTWPKLCLRHSLYKNVTSCRQQNRMLEDSIEKDSNLGTFGSLSNYRSSWWTGETKLLFVCVFVFSFFNCSSEWLWMRQQMSHMGHPLDCIGGGGSKKDGQTTWR